MRFADKEDELISSGGMEEWVTVEFTEEATLNLEFERRLEISWKNIQYKRHSSERENNVCTEKEKGKRNLGN